MSVRTNVLVALTVGCFATNATAQFDNAWVEFEPATGRIRDASGAVATHVTGDPQEKDYAWGDLDQDGWTDLVVMRKQPFTTSGAYPNQLLMNEGGLLVDRSAQHAIASDILGDNGFLTPTNDRDAVIADVNLDGWLDVVTAVTLSDGQPKHISHPRVYVNQGADQNGHWQGLRFEDSRIPMMSPTPKFNALAAGDVTGDGAPDLYFADSGNLEDKLLINDGNGFFSDSGSTRMTSSMLSSHFGTAATIVDMNADGANDVVRCTGLTGSPGNGPYVSVAYNDPNNVGHFPQSLFQNNAVTGSTYHVAVGDLNQDQRPDVVYVDDALDGYRYNTANNGAGQAVWGPKKPYQFLSGADQGFGGNIVIADLDGDGWNDTIHADVDVDATGCGRYAHIYHNPGGVAGAQLTLLEEAELAGTQGWKGAKGLRIADTLGTYDVAVFDLDRDGDLDLVFGRCTGTFVWLNETFLCAPHYAYGEATANSTGQTAVIFSNGDASLSANQLVIAASRMPASKSGLFIYGTQRLFAPAPFGNGNRWIGGSIQRLGVQVTDLNGDVTLAADFNVAPLNTLLPGDFRDFQFWYRDPAAGGAASNVSDALEIVFCP